MGNVLAAAGAGGLDLREVGVGGLEPLSCALLTPARWGRFGDPVLMAFWLEVSRLVASWFRDVEIGVAVVELGQRTNLSVGYTPWREY